MTLGMIVDEMGFPKTSKLFEGNVSEPATLIEMIEGLQGNTIDKRNNSEKGECSKKDKKGITVVIDAGIAKEENLTLLKREGYDYLCVARNKPVDFSEIDKTALLMIKQDRNNKVEVQMIKKGKESILYCKSYLKAKKEEAMRCSFQERFEKNLKEIAASLSKKGGTKKYDKVLERIGRQKERYSSIAHYYTIEVTQKDGIATTIEWKFTKEQKAEERFSGSYFLRTSRVDLTEEEIWSLYIMLTNVEDAFRYLKSELALRPIWHQKEVRSDAHLFNTLLAYHLLISIQTELKRDEIYMRWCHIRDLLSSHVGITTAMTNKKGKRIYIRDCSDPEPFHKRIYNALKLSYCPIKAKRIKI